MNEIQLTLDVKPSKYGNSYVALVADLGYCKRNLVCNRQLLNEIFDCPPSVMQSLPKNTSIPVGYLSTEIVQCQGK